MLSIDDGLKYIASIPNCVFLMDESNMFYDSVILLVLSAVHKRVKLFLYYLTLHPTDGYTTRLYIYFLKLAALDNSALNSIADLDHQLDDSRISIGLGNTSIYCIFHSI